MDQPLAARPLARAAYACQAIMSATSVIAVLLMVVGALAAHAGSRVGAIAFLSAWLLWPLGALACGLVVLAAQRWVEVG